MSEISNVVILDTRDIAEDLAKEITSIANIGLLIESDESQILLKNCEKINIGSNLKLSKDVDVDFITENGDIEIDRDYLEGLLKPVILVVNGSLTFEEDIDNKVLGEKIYKIVVNGELICCKKLAGIIQSKGVINGEVIRYNNNYKLIGNSFNLTNNFLKNLPQNSKLAFEQLIITEEIDKELLKENISDIQVIDKLIIVDEYEDIISSYINKYYEVEKTIIPKGVNTVKYIDDDICINDSSIKKYNQITLYVDGDVKISLKDNIEFGKHIEYLICDKVVCSEKVFDMIKDNLSSDVEVEILNGKLMLNRGNMTFTGNIEERVTIKNKGRLVFDESIDYDKFNKNVESIINYGLILVSKDKLDIVKEKVKDNYGKISSLEDYENKKQNSDKKTLYANMVKVKL